PGRDGLVRVRWPHDPKPRHGAHGGEVFDGLMSRAIFADTYRIMCPGVDDAMTRECCQTNSRAHVVTEDEERTADRQDPTMGREAVHDRRHRVLTYPEEDLFAIGMLTGLTILTFEKRSRVTREIGTATDEAGDDIDQCGQDLTRGGTCGDLGSHVEFWKRIAPIVGRRDRRSG